MARFLNSTPINPNAKYFSNSISNVLYCIQKFDQGTLAWPTGPRKRQVWTKQMCRSPQEILFDGTGSSVIPKSSLPKSKYYDGVDKKNTFYQILQASQDQSCFEKTDRRRRIACKCECDPVDDSIYNEIYDIVKTQLQYKSHPRLEVKPLQRVYYPKECPSVGEIYKVRPRLEVKPLQRVYYPEECHSVRETYNMRPLETESTCMLKPSEGEKLKKKSCKVKYPIVVCFRPREKPNDHSPKPFRKETGINECCEHPIRDTVQATVPETGTHHPIFLVPRSIPIKQIYKVPGRTPSPQMQKEKSKESFKSQFKSPKAEHPAIGIPIIPEAKIKDSSKKALKPKHKPSKGQHPQEESRVETRSGVSKPRPKYPRKKHETTEIDSLKLNSEEQLNRYIAKNHKNQIYRPRERRSIKKEELSPLIPDLPSGINSMKPAVEKEPENSENIAKREESLTEIESEIQEPMVHYRKNKYSTVIPPKIWLPKVMYKMVSKDVSEASVAPPIYNVSTASGDRKRFTGTLESTKVSLNSTLDYDERLRRLKDILYNHSMTGDCSPNLSYLDITGIDEKDLLLYPYNEIYNEVSSTDKVVKKRKKSAKKVKPQDMEEIAEEPLKKKSACSMCKAIWSQVKEAPFLEEMRREQKRQELMAWRANMEKWKPNPARQFSIRDLDRKLYSLEDKDIRFNRLKRSNSSIFPKPSKTNTFLKRCNSFTFSKESTSIICS